MEEREITIVFTVSGATEKEEKRLKNKTDEEIATMIIEGGRVDLVDGWYILDEH